MKITLAQLNPIVGDVKGNLARLQQECVVAAQAKSDLIIFSELYLTGYPPRDLLNRPWFLDVVDTALQQIATLSAQMVAPKLLFSTLHPIKIPPSSSSRAEPTLAEE